MHSPNQVAQGSRSRGDMGGVVVESLQAELAKAQAPVLPPINVQISKLKEFIERSERRLVWLEADRD